MAKPTDRLRQAREEAGLTMEDVQDRTNIQIRYLQAMEKGDFSLLPGKYYTRAFLRNYAEFLHLDPTPMIHQFEEFQSEADSSPLTEEKKPSPVLSRKERYAADKAEEKKSSLLVRKLLSMFAIPKKGSVWLLVIGLILLIPAVIAYFVFSDDPPEEKKGESTVRAESGRSSEDKKDTSQVRLVKPSETYDYGDVFEVSNAKKVEVTVEADKNTWFRFRPGGPTEKIGEEANLAAGEKKNFEHPEWISLMIGNPNYVKLTVNGHVIDTTEEKNAHAYQLKLKK
ncbi:XRE family transcriptional regulator [Kroppenstedtia guangzhouensis]|uniref:XRE family transcriptional regulator n=1 Tax=Kroppenstedtia guangzhouensis TaxID=1274356 RepID=A0ABQ1FZR2_9BACL|nr:RodZ domain-containing protein [Kroppenstedtia guangzhouensis]GGA34631.1 XRE family transcriptional regulator [Kroppenstedtia guangzhouensis]